MTDGTAFGLAPGHLGGNRVREVFLHARVSAALDRLAAAFPGCLVDVLDRAGDRMSVPAPADAFVRPVEEFDVPAGAPDRIVIYGQDAAAHFGAEFPDMPARRYDGPGDGVAFELDPAHLGLDRFGLVDLSDEVRQALGAVLGNASGSASRWKVFDGEGMPVRTSLTGASERIAGPVPLNGFEPRHVVLYDRAAAERFARLFPALEREELAALERRWRAARLG